jgi:hypothetical protein
MRAQLALGFGNGAAEQPPELQSPILEELSRLEVDSLTPMQALQTLHRWRAAGRSE